MGSYMQHLLTAQGHDGCKHSARTCSMRHVQSTQDASQGGRGPTARAHAAMHTQHHTDQNDACSTGSLQEGTAGEVPRSFFKQK